MKSLIYVLGSLLLFVACKSEPKTTVNPTEKQLTVAQKIANAHGFENWKNINEIQFTFNVDKDSTHFERSWIWQPKTNNVTMTLGDNVVSYNRKAVDSLSQNADKGFINDKFWLLIPFQLVWDKSATISEVKKANAPIAKTPMQMITITYPLEGGYTPGDAYDIYFGDDYIINEWTFRKANDSISSLITTFENYQNINGIKIAKDHKRGESSWNLNFTNVKVITR